MRIGNSNYQMPPLTKVNKILVIGIVGVFLLHSILKLTTGAYLSQFLSLNGGSFLSGHLYQILTYPFMATGLFEVIFDCLILWFIGGELELLWGQKRYVKFLFCSTFCGGLLFLMISSLLSAWTFLSGPGGMCYALLLAYGILFPDRSLLLYFFPVKAKWFCLILIGMLTYQGIFTPGAAGAWGHLGAMASGFGFMIFASRNSLSLPKFGQKKRSKSKAKLRIVKDDDEEGPKTWH